MTPEVDLQCVSSSTSVILCCSSSMLPGSMTHQTGQITLHCRYQEMSLNTSDNGCLFKVKKGAISGILLVYNCFSE